MGIQNNFIDLLRAECSQDFSVTDIPTSAEMMGDDESEYVRLEEVARGGSKVIYRALDNVCRRVVAMAVPIEGTDERGQRDFLREAYICSYLQHPNIIPVYHIGKTEEDTFYTMKLIEGASLGDILKGLSAGDETYLKDYDQARLLEIFVSIANAIAYAHAMGIVHLDLKPENIQISKYGEVLVCDWGLARIIEARCDVDLLDRVEFAPELKLNSTGIRGTPGYMSPEQTKLTGLTDEKSDIYSLGAILYSILTFRPPVDESSASESIRKTRVGDWRPPSEVTDQLIPLSVESVIMKCLNRDPELRYDLAAAIVDDIRRCIRGYAAHAEQAGLWRQIHLLYMRNKRFCLSVTVSAVVIGGLIISFMNALRTEKNIAEQAQATAEEQSRHLIEEKRERERVSKVAANHRFREGMDLSKGRIEFELAYAAFEQCVFLDPENEAAWERKGSIELGNLEFDKALASYSHITDTSLVDDKKREVVKSYREKFKKQKPSDDDVIDFAVALEQLHMSFACRTVYLSILGKDLPLNKRISYLEDLIIAINRLSPEKRQQIRFTVRNGEVDLNVSGLYGLHYLPPLHKLPIRSLDLSGTNIKDTLPLKDTKLKILKLSDTWLEKLRGCEGLPLEELHLSVNSMRSSNRLVSTKTLRKLYIPKGTRRYYKEYRIPIPDHVEVIEE